MPRGSLPKVYDADLVERVAMLYGSGHTQAEIAALISVSQKVIWRLMVRHNIHARVAAKRDQRGDRNSTWGYSSVTYAAYHKRVEVARGKPKRCEDCGAEGHDRVYDWACLGRYDRIEDYKRLCRSCHWKLDGKINNIRRSEVARDQ